MQAKEYHGWRNYPTWAAYTWLTNDAFLYKEALGVTHGKGIPEAAIALRNFVASWIPDVENLPGLFWDLLEYVLEEEVDWASIVEALREEK